MGGQHLQDCYEERLKDNTVTPPPAAAAFRIDFPGFRGGMTRRDRKLAEFLSLGNSPKRAASRFRISQGRVTQLRQQWCRQWLIGQGETVAGTPRETGVWWAELSRLPVEYNRFGDSLSMLRGLKRRFSPWFI